MICACLPTQSTHILGKAGELLWLPQCQECLLKYESVPDEVCADAMCLATMEETDGAKVKKPQEEKEDKSHLKAPLSSKVEQILKKGPVVGAESHAGKVVAELMKMDISAIEGLLVAEELLKEQTLGCFESLREDCSLVTFLRSMNSAECSDKGAPRQGMFETFDGVDEALHGVYAAERLTLAVCMLTGYDSDCASDIAMRLLSKYESKFPVTALEDPVALKSLVEEVNGDGEGPEDWNSFTDKMRCSLFGFLSEQEAGEHDFKSHNRDGSDSD